MGFKRPLVQIQSLGPKDRSTERYSCLLVCSVRVNQRPLENIIRPPCGRRAAFTAADGRWFKSSHSDQKRDMRKHVSFLVRVQRRFAAQISASLKLLGGDNQSPPKPAPCRLAGAYRRPPGVERSAHVHQQILCFQFRKHMAESSETFRSMFRGVNFFF